MDDLLRSPGVTLRPIISALGLVMCSAVVASACGSSSPKKSQLTDGGEGGGAGEAQAGQGGEAPSPLGGQGGATGTPGGGAPDAGTPAVGGMPDPGGQGGAAPVMSGGNLSLPGSLKFNISCGSVTPRATLSLTNWGAEEIELSAGQIKGAFTLDTVLPLTIGAGESAEVVVSTAAGVIGTDAPGEKRHGTLTLTSNLGTALVQLDGVIAGAALEVDSIRGLALPDPLPFVCGASDDPAPRCATQTFTIVNSGASPALLQPPFGKQFAAAAFVPGSPDPLTLAPGEAVRVEVRPAANGPAFNHTNDTLVIPVEGSCDADQLEVPLLIEGFANCFCAEAPPGIEASPVVADYICGATVATDVAIFNGSTSPFDVTGIEAPGGGVPVQNTLPLQVPSGQSAVLKPLLAQKYPGQPGSTRFAALVHTTLGDVLSDVQLRATGGRPFFNFGAVGPNTSVAISSCAPVDLTIDNLYGTGPVTVSPPVASGGISIGGFSAPQTILGGEKFVFQIAAVSNAGSGCATTGNLDFAMESNCGGPSMAQGTTYTGPCSCDGI